MTLSLSIDRVLDSVYAHSTAEIVATGITRPEILGRAHTAMLRVIVRDTIAGLSFAMAHAITNSNIGENPIPDIITVDVNLLAELSQPVFRAAVETAVAAGTLAQAWSGSESPMSDRYSRAYDMSLQTILRMVGRGVLPGAISPTA